MASEIPAIGLDQLSSNTTLAGDVGNILNLGGRTVRLVKFTAALTLDAGTVLEWDDVDAFTVNGLADAAETVGQCAGAVPDELDGKTTASGDYGYLVIGGIATGSTADATAAGAALAVHGASGLLDDTTVTENTTVARGIEAAGGAADVKVKWCIG